MRRSVIPRELTFDPKVPGCFRLLTKPGYRRNDSEEVFELNDRRYHLRASCRGSHGYCYISAWQEQSEPR